MNLGRFSLLCGTSRVSSSSQCQLTRPLQLGAPQLHGSCSFPLNLQARCYVRANAAS